MGAEHATPLDAQVAEWIDDLAEPEQATERIVALGRAALEPLCAYLDRGPQVVSQPREFAVRMLARLRDPRATGRLQQLLHDNRLHTLSAALAESEYRIKDAAMAGLAEQLGEAAAEDVAFGVRSERLPSALRAAGRLRLHVLAPSLAALLDDDVLAETAAEALHALRPESVPSLLAAVDAWLSTGANTPRTRLALVRAFAWLAAAEEKVPPDMQWKAIHHSCVPVRAAAALAVDGTAHADLVAASLAHGALGADEWLAVACRRCLKDSPGLPAGPLLHVWQANAETDVYGNTWHPTPAARQALLGIALHQVRSGEDLLRIAGGLPPEDLSASLLHWHGPDAPWLEIMLNHASAKVRLAAVACLLRYPVPARQRWLARCLGDRDRRVRRKAFEVLVTLIGTRQASFTAAALSPRTLLRAPRACLRLLFGSAHSRR